MELPEDVLSQWEIIVSEAHKTEIPVECIQKVVFKLTGKQKQKTVNIHSLVRQGMEFPEIEEVLSRMFADMGDIIRDVDFIIDIRSVALMVQPETDKLLEKL